MANALTVIGALSNAMTVRKDYGALVPVGDRGGWWHSVVREPYTGAWQRNQEISRESVLMHPAVYACVTLISSDIAKCRLRTVQQDSDGIWNEFYSNAFSPVLAQPNGYQNRIQFIESWMFSKLVVGNTYVLKSRDARRVVNGLYVLNPERIKALVAPNGDRYFKLSKDNLAGIEADSIDVPASEIIHDYTTLRYHHLSGVPPLAPATLPARHGLSIQQSSSRYFDKGSRPGGVLSAPAGITEATAKRIKEYWDNNFSGDNTGKVAVLGDGLKFEPMAYKAVDSQLIEQLESSSKSICTAFNVPPHKIHVGAAPSYNNIEALNQQYYTDCLQKYIEAIELLLDVGLGLTEVQGKTYGTEFDLDDLFRMDTATQFKAMSDGVRGGFIAPNEARKKLNYGPKAGGDSPFMQHQDYSLEALAKRDAQEDPFAAKTPLALPAPSPKPDEERELGDLDIADIASITQVVAKSYFERAASGLEG